MQPLPPRGQKRVRVLLAQTKPVTLEEELEALSANVREMEARYECTSDVHDERGARRN